MEFKIKEEVAQAILNYLGTRPYAEVFQLIQGLQTLEKVEVKATESTPLKNTGNGKN